MRKVGDSMTFCYVLGLSIGESREKWIIKYKSLTFTHEFFEKSPLQNKEHGREERLGL